MNRSASGPRAGVLGCSGRLKTLFFPSAIGEPHQLLNQASNLLGGQFVTGSRLLHLHNREPIASGLGVAHALLYLGAEDRDFVLGESIDHLATEYRVRD